MNLVKIELDVSVIRAARAALFEKANETLKRAERMTDPGLAALLKNQSRSLNRDVAQIDRALAAVGFNARP